MQNLDMLDLITIMSFVIGLMNYDENLTQNDKQELQEDFSRKVNRVLKEIHEHLEKQDAKIEEILLLLKGVEER